MFDIFEEKPQPKIYCADVTISVKIPQRGKQKKYDSKTIKLYKIPLVMNDGDIATDHQKKVLFKKVHENEIGKGKYEDMIFSIVSIDNIKYMSNLSYKFDYLIH